MSARVGRQFRPSRIERWRRWERCHQDFLASVTALIGIILGLTVIVMCNPRY